MPEDRATRIKRLRMRSMRRGIKEMDLILSAFSAAHLDDMDEAGLDLYDRLLSENDLEIFGWITRQGTPPASYTDLMARITLFAQGVARPV